MNRTRLNRRKKLSMELDFISRQLLKAQPLWVLVLSALGFLSLLQSSITLLKWTYAAFLRPRKDLKVYGSWALVTGATDGIGKSFAFQLAHIGLHLVLIGRNPNKLRRVSDEIKAKHCKAEIKLVVIDLNGDLSDGIQLLEKEIEGLDVGILVNNAGTTYPHLMYFHEVEEELWERIVRVNVEATTRITRAVLPGMIRRGRGAVVSIGSGSSVVLPSFPLAAVYAATKAYINQFSKSLHVEYKSMGIDVQCQIPLYVATKMIKVKQSSMFIPSTDGYTSAAMRWIGYEPLCTPYWSHYIQWCLVCLFPNFILNSWLLYLGNRKKSQI